MSPSVITSVAVAPMLRIDETGLPISTSRVSTMPRDRRADGGVAQFLLGPLDGGARLRDLGAGLGDLGLRDDELALGAALPVLGHLEGALGVVEARLGDRASASDRSSARSKARRANSTSGPSASTLVLLELRLGAAQAGLGRLEVGAAPRAAAPRSFSLSSSASTWPGVDDVADVDVQRLDDAVGLRLDLDLRDRLDLAGGDDRPDHRVALDGGKSTPGSKSAPALADAAKR